MRVRRWVSFSLLLCLTLSTLAWAGRLWDPVQGRGELARVFDWIGLGQYDLALRAAEKATWDDPADLEAHLILALLLQERGDGNRAEEEYRRVLTAPMDRPYLLTILGQIHLAREEWAKAASLFQAARAQSADLIQADVGLAQALDGGGDRTAAVAALRDLVARASIGPEPYMLLGDLLTAKGAKPRELVTLYTRAVEMNPGDVDLRLRLARTLAETGEDERARQEYTRVLLLTPEDLEARAALVED